MIVLVDYASPSVFESTRDSNLVGIAANARRPVRFHGTVVEHSFLLRIALRALGEAIWSDDTWIAQSDLLDPVITVHPDRIFFRPIVYLGDFSHPEPGRTGNHEPVDDHHRHTGFLYQRLPDRK